MCLSPVILVNDKNKYHTEKTQAVPCGKCVQCLSRRKNQWVFRLQQEDKAAKTAAFLTLTYSDDNLPITPNGLQTLRVKDVQDYMKRLRKNTPKNKKYPIRYFQAGEYGSITKRPHYHQLLFNLPHELLTEKNIKEKWQNGHISIGQVTGASIAYTAKYMLKGTFKPENETDDREPERATMSNGIGKNFLTPNMKRYLQDSETPFVTMEQGQKIALPEYYKNKVFTENQKKAITKNHYNETEYRSEKHKHEHIKHQIEQGERKQREAEQKSKI